MAEGAEAERRNTIMASVALGVSLAALLLSVVSLWFAREDRTFDIQTNRASLWVHEGRLQRGEPPNEGEKHRFQWRFKLLNAAARTAATGGRIGSMTHG